MTGILLNALRGFTIEAYQPLLCPPYCLNTYNSHRLPLGFWMVECDLGSGLYTIRTKIIGHLLALRNNSVSYRSLNLWLSTPSCPLCLDYKCSIPQAQHLYGDFLDTGQSETWAFWHILPRRGCSPSCPQSLARARMLDKVAILPDTFATWESLGSKWMKEWEFINYMDGIATIKGMALAVAWSCFLSPSWCAPDKVYYPKVSKFAKLQTAILVLNVLVSRIPYLYIFLK